MSTTGSVRQSSLETYSEDDRRKAEAVWRAAEERERQINALMEEKAVERRCMEAERAEKEAKKAERRQKKEEAAEAEWQ